MELLRVIVDDKLSPSAKVLLFGIIAHNGERFLASEFCKLLNIEVVVFNKAVHDLLSSNMLTATGVSLTFAYDDDKYSVDIVGFGSEKVLKRVPSNIITRARKKLENLRLSTFVGRDMDIYKVSLEYDKMMMKYRGKAHISLPAAPTFAKKAKNWILFKNVHDLITERGFHPVLYIKAQFEAMKKTTKFGVTYPYVSMLASNWAVNNYVNYIKDNVEMKTETKMIASEQDVIREVITNSHIVVLQIAAANPELTRLQCLLVAEGSLSPLYLALNKEYLKYMNTAEQEYDEDIMRVMKRMSKDREYKKIAVEIYMNLPEKLDGRPV